MQRPQGLHRVFAAGTLKGVAMRWMYHEVVDFRK